MKEVKLIKPFTRFLMTIGELPSSYLVSMTYEEQLLWFCNFLQNTVIPTINNNSEAVIELQEFVANYFDNLDVQAEIDHKLDEMAESGELAEIIAEYISINAIFSFDTIADMASAENLQDGADVYCLGKDTYNDGKGAFYKIREITISDVIDGYNIVGITNTENLIGERLPNYEINQINDAINTINDTTIPGIQDDIDTINNTTIPGVQDDINTINNTTIPGINDAIDTINNTTIPGVENEINTINNTTIPGIYDAITATNNAINTEKANRILNGQTIPSLVVISDSYGVMDGTTNYPNYMKQYLGLDNDHFYNNSYGGVGFDHANNNKTFITLVNECATNLSAERRAEVTHLLIAGGYNDQWSTDADILTAINTCLGAAHTVFPNATIYIAHIGWSTNNSSLEHTYKDYCDACGLHPFAKYVVNSENILRGDLMSLDNIHPNTEGLQYLAMNLITGLQTGSCDPSSEYKYITDTNNNNLGVAQIQNNVLTFEMYEREYTYTGTADGTEIPYCTLNNSSMITGHANLMLVVPCMFIGSNEYVMGFCTMKISQRVITLKPIALNASGNNFKSFNYIRFYYGTYVIPHKCI